MNVKLITITPNAEATIAYITRVTSDYQDNPEFASLLRRCIEHKHWSPFEHAFMTVEIITSRAILQQIVRHRSFTFSVFSQRYAEPSAVEFCEARASAMKNRQSSIDVLGKEVKEAFSDMQKRVWAEAYAAYRTARELGVAKECARMLLPECTQTRLYMTGNVRSWIHYIDLRTQEDTQLEHRLVAEGIKEIFAEQLPVIAEALKWNGISKDD